MNLSRYRFLHLTSWSWILIILFRWKFVTAVILSATVMNPGLGGVSISPAVAAPNCPGQLTSDGLACCAPGSMPTGDDNCQLAVGGQAAACTLSQLTSSGTCCPPSSVPQSDGTCQSNGFTAQGCPLGQLDKGGLTCCPVGQTPQADGSCQQAAAVAPTTPAGISACPNGFVFQPNVGGCIGVPIACPSSSTNIGGTPVSVPGTPLAGTPTLGAVSNPGYTLGCCPYPSGQVTSSSSCEEGGQGTIVTIPAVAPTCPPGSKAYNFFDSDIYVCVQAAACPAHFHVDHSSGMCDLNPIGFNANSIAEVLQLDDRGSCGAGTVPRRAFVNDLVCVSPSVSALTILDNIAAPARTKLDGSCIQGYVWRQAIPSDHACVTPATRTQAQSDNRASAKMQGSVQQQAAPPQSGFTPPPGISGAVLTTTHTLTNTTKPTSTAPVPCQPGEVRTDRGCEKEPTPSNTNVQTPLKGLTPPRPVTVQKQVTPPKLHIAKPSPPRLNIAKPPPPKLPSGPEDKQKR